MPSRRAVVGGIAAGFLGGTTLGLLLGGPLWQEGKRAWAESNYGIEATVEIHADAESAARALPEEMRPYFDRSNSFTKFEITGADSSDTLSITGTSYRDVHQVGTSNIAYSNRGTDFTNVRINATRPGIQGAMSLVLAPMFLNNEGIIDTAAEALYHPQSRDRFDTATNSFGQYSENVEKYGIPNEVTFQRTGDNVLYKVADIRSLWTGKPENFDKHWTRERAKYEAMAELQEA